MKLDFLDEEEKLLLQYSPEQENIAWLYGDNVPVKKTFFFRNKDRVMIDENVPCVVFQLGDLDITKKYFVIDGAKLGIPISISFDRSIQLKKEYFIATRNISIFRHIAHVVKSDIIIGKDESANLQFDTFQKLIKQFPNTTEITKYANKCIANIVRDELDNTIDADAEYEKFLKHKIKDGKNFTPPEKIIENEKTKYQYLYNKLSNMLQTQDEYVYKEKLWQHEILEVIKIIFPRYIDVMEEVTICDVYTGKSKRLDFLLIDYNGNIDIIEIKRPSTEPILTNGLYNSNCVPLRKLTETIMQVEKYIFYLCKWGKAGEDKLTSYRTKKGMPEIEINITNPQGIIIFGKDVPPEQKQDFEIIKRKYKNIVDIITYEDLLRRLKMLIDKFSNETNMATKYNSMIPQEVYHGKETVQSGTYLRFRNLRG